MDVTRLKLAIALALCAVPLAGCVVEPVYRRPVYYRPPPPPPPPPAVIIRP